MTLLLTEQQQMIRDTARRFAANRLAPGAAARAREGQIEQDILREVGDLGFLGMTVPEEQCGIGADYVSYALALMEIAAGDGAVSTMMSVHNAPFCAILTRFADPAQQASWLLPAAQGAFIGAFALTEPQAGSDASNLRSRAVATADGFVLNGSKQFITSAKICGGMIAFAVTDPAADKKGISAFYIEKETPGLEIGPAEHKMGQSASDTCSVQFRDLEVGRDALTGTEGEGYRIALSSLETGRIGIAAQAVGMAQAALDIAVAYSKERVAFWHADRPTSGGCLPPCGNGCTGRNRASDGAPCRSAQGRRTTVLREASIAKLFATRMAESVTSDAIQTLGGYGYLKDFPLERIARDARVCQIYEGTSDIQLINISRILLEQRT